MRPSPAENPAASASASIVAADLPAAQPLVIRVTVEQNDAGGLEPRAGGIRYPWFCGSKTVPTASTKRRMQVLVHVCMIVLAPVAAAYISSAELRARTACAAC
jgi:hypothetical protein